ncbi:MAG: 23S rRNA (adenine(2503)-C(2))-methyltransferase RlmN [Dehalococcoidales bacterium]
MPVYFTDLNVTEVKKLVVSLNEPAYRAKQLLGWVYRKTAVSWDEMTDLPLSFRQKLAAVVNLHTLTPIHEIKAKDGTVKVLFSLPDGKTVETALMKFPAAHGEHRYTVCLSTQVGCPIGCPFCATGQQGFERNLTAGEIIDQVLYFARRLQDKNNGREGERVDNIVFMGMGEPLANYDALRQAIEMLNAKDGFGLSARSMTISTSGLIPGIKQLAEEKLQVGLAVSLHAPDDKLRNQLVPVKKKYPLEELIPACREYITKTGRRVSYEYALFDGVNDSLSQAQALADLLQGMNCHVNLITANSTANQTLRPSPRQKVLAFRQALKSRGITCTLRQSRGQDIDAGCGQLRSRFLA